ncbi:ABC transporter permease [Halorussus salinisoli]|uniref:ABC transporter permease n=1 Tax=Halorussus salinisoli TaxID=2558242 RepID=UPI0010C1A2A0|nr:ABC transporter permease [Halorussus salinisoli]
MSQPEATDRSVQQSITVRTRVNELVSRYRDHLASAQLFVGLTYLLIFFVVSFAIIVFYSVLKTAPPADAYEFTIQNYIEFLTDEFYRTVLWESIFIGIQVTVITLAIAYPVAYFLAFTESAHKNLLVLLVILPFWINIVIRTYAWRLILGRQGVLNYLFVTVFGVMEQPGDYLFSQGSIVLGLVHVFLPFMLLPIYTSLNRFDRTQIEAAKNLGANKLRAFYEVTLPQSLPGIAAGVAIVYVLAFGSFVVPLLLGGSRNIMIANVISEMFGQFQAWEVGSAMAVVVTAISLTLVFVFNHLVGLGGLYGGESA